MAEPGVRLLALMLMLGAGAARAQERPFCADRPGKDTPPCVLDAGRWQVEASFADYALQRQDGVETKAWSFGDLEVRRGLAPRLEAQLYWSPYVTVRVRDDATGLVDKSSGSGDLALALRWSLRNPDGGGFSAALQPYVSAPTGADGIGAGKWAGGVLLPVGIELPGGAGLALTPEVDVTPDADGNGAHLAWSGVAGMSRGFGPVTLAADVWAQLDDDPAGRTTQATLDLSAAWTPAPVRDLQLDVGVNLGLTEDTPDVEVLAGIAKRF